MTQRNYLDPCRALGLKCIHLKCLFLFQNDGKILFKRSRKRGLFDQRSSCGLPAATKPNSPCVLLLARFQWSFVASGGGAQYVLEDAGIWNSHRVVLDGNSLITMKKYYIYIVNVL